MVREDWGDDTVNSNNNSNRTHNPDSRSPPTPLVGSKLNTLSVRFSFPPISDLLCASWPNQSLLTLDLRLLIDAQTIRDYETNELFSNIAISCPSLTSLTVTICTDWREGWNLIPTARPNFGTPRPIVAHPRLCHFKFHHVNGLHLVKQDIAILAQRWGSTLVSLDIACAPSIDPNVDGIGQLYLDLPKLL
jgi:hypothetical protein